MSGISSLTSSHSTHSLSDVWARSDDRERALKDAWLESREEIQTDPVTYSTLKDPVVDEGGHTFNRSTLFQLPIALDHHKEEIPNHVVCPIGRELIDLTKLRFNYHAQSTVGYFAQERILSSSSSSKEPTIADLMKEIGSVKEDNQKMAKTLKKVEKTCDGLRKDNASLKARCTQLEKDNSGLKETCTRLGKDNASLKARCTQLEKDNASLKARCTQLEKDNSGLKETCDGLRKDLQKVETERDGLKTTLKKSQDTAKALHIRCQNLEGRSFLDKLFSLLPCRYDSEIIDTNLTDEQLKLIGEYDRTITTTR